jgi:large subunit ribosomal protein L35
MFRAAVAAFERSISSNYSDLARSTVTLSMESKMPKLKSKSGAKKRFRITGTGKVLAAHSGKRHGMIKRTTKQIRQLRGTTVISESDAERVRKIFLPYGRT